MPKPTSKAKDHVGKTLNKLKNLSPAHMDEVLAAADHPGVKAIEAAVAKIKANPANAAASLAEIATRWDMTMATVVGVHAFIAAELAPLGIATPSLADGVAAAVKKLA